MYLCVSKWREEEGSLTTVGSLNPARFSLSRFPSLSLSLVRYIYLPPAPSSFHSASSLAVLSLSFSFRLFICLAFGILLSLVLRARSSGLLERQRSAIYILYVKILFTARANHRLVPTSSFASHTFLVFLIGPTYLTYLSTYLLTYLPTCLPACLPT